MRAHDISMPKKRVTQIDNKSLGIQFYDVNNDYPQRIDRIISESGTAEGCLSVYAKFINGQGFKSLEANEIINRDGINLNQLLKVAARDYARKWGLAIHVNYNEAYEAVEYQYVEFNYCRLGLPDDTKYVGKIAIHDNWECDPSRETPNQNNIKWVDIFNPDPAVIQAQIDAAGGIDKYNGQILWFSSAYGFNYPISICDPVITDINTEGGVATIKNRNVKNGFFPAGVFVVNESAEENPDNEEENRNRKYNDNDPDDSSIANIIKQLQKDENACKMALITKDPDEEMPAFIKMETNNYDKSFSYTEESVQNNIGRRFFQPPILRCQDVSVGFATEQMQEAYTYYNAITADERSTINDIFNRLLAVYTNILDLTEFRIEPLKYAQANE